MFLEVFDKPIAFVHERSRFSLTMHDRRNGVDVTTKHSRSVTRPRRRRSFQ